MSEDYSQPDFFRFGSDSISLVHEILKSSKFRTHPCRLIELGTGCGVIACELSQKMKFSQVTLVEAQTEWQPYLEANIRRFLKAETISIAWETVGKFNLDGKIQADLIVCNPPYFQPSEGRPSQDQRRNIAHRFILDPWDEWLKCMERSLALGGEAWFLQKKPTSQEFKLNQYSLTLEMNNESLNLYCLRRLNIE